MTKITFSLKEDLKDEFYNVCEKNMHTPSVVLRQIIKRYIKENKEGK